MTQLNLEQEKISPLQIRSIPSKRKRLSNYKQGFSSCKKGSMSTHGVYTCTSVDLPDQSSQTPGIKLGIGYYVYNLGHGIPLGSLRDNLGGKRNGGRKDPVSLPLPPTPSHLSLSCDAVHTSTPGALQQVFIYGKFTWHLKKRKKEKKKLLH